MQERFYAVAEGGKVSDVPPDPLLAQELPAPLTAADWAWLIGGGGVTLGLFALLVRWLAREARTRAASVNPPTPTAAPPPPPIDPQP